MRGYSSILGRARWAALVAALVTLASLFITTSAQAVVVTVNGTSAGVALLPVSGERAKLPPARWPRTTVPAAIPR